MDLTKSTRSFDSSFDTLIFGLYDGGGLRLIFAFDLSFEVCVYGLDHDKTSM